ncbi:GAF and ANTAR domain-containing protein [Mycobacterium sp.]|uniref:ANTAR domain-containing response regulator n=1 Tax=Mycobacterium sp. TaxID=1785 RepID=UPI0025DBC5AF|nr:GAF and ANTAR domain-containing protein [Mycobacterium sp.]
MSRSQEKSAPGAVDGDLELLSELDGLRALGDKEFDALHVLCRALHVEEADLQGTLIAILTAATAAINGADEAGLNLYAGGRFEPQATIGKAPPQLDALQQRTKRGPCIDASRKQASIHVDDLAVDQRWPEFAAAGLELGIHSMLCVPLWVDDRRLGSLSLYARSPVAFDDSAKRLADLYATHGALALLEAQRADQLQRAIASRDLIGQAKGVLMERHRITADQAFALLRGASQRLNVKVADIAESVATTGDLPPLEGAGSAG